VGRRITAGRDGSQVLRMKISQRTGLGAVRRRLVMSHLVGVDFVVLHVLGRSIEPIEQVDREVRDVLEPGAIGAWLGLAWLGLAWLGLD
jgi:hypothetical protein